MHLHHHACQPPAIAYAYHPWLHALVSVTSQHYACQLLATAFPSFQPMLLHLHHRACQFVFASPSSQLLATLDLHHYPSSCGHLHWWLYCIYIITPPFAAYITLALSHHQLLVLQMHHHHWPIASLLHPHLLSSQFGPLHYHYHCIASS